MLMVTRARSQVRSINGLICTSIIIIVEVDIQLLYDLIERIFGNYHPAFNIYAYEDILYLIICIIIKESTYFF
jgi:hypothetical protein